MYFIIDGAAEVLDDEEEVVVTFETGTPFGEMALLNPKPTVRSA